MMAEDGAGSITFIDPDGFTTTASPAEVLDNDYLPSNFLYSVDGGITWSDATGPNGTVVKIPTGDDSILVRVFPLADDIRESDEFFTLGVSEVIFGVVSDSTDTGNGIILFDELLQ
jgi:hypothetical protein